MAGLDFKFFDCDNHYYEALDAFTRHIEPEYRKRAIQWAELDGKSTGSSRTPRSTPSPGRGRWTNTSVGAIRRTRT